MLRQKSPHEIKNRKLNKDDCAIFVICYPAITLIYLLLYLFILHVLHEKTGSSTSGNNTLANLPYSQKFSGGGRGGREMGGCFIN
jgi:hypothetical protein